MAGFFTIIMLLEEGIFFCFLSSIGLTLRKFLEEPRTESPGFRLKIDIELGSRGLRTIDFWKPFLWLSQSACSSLWLFRFLRLCSRLSPTTFFALEGAGLFLLKSWTITFASLLWKEEYFFSKNLDFSSTPLGLYPSPSLGIFSFQLSFSWLLPFYSIIRFGDGE